MSAEWAETPAADNHGVPGKTLAAQREAMGWTVEQVADQLKLAVRQVVALEQGDYANLPGPAVVRGFVRAYAKVVKLDPVPLVAQIALETPAATDATLTTVRRDKPASFSQVRYPSNGKRANKLPLGLIAGVLVLAGALGAAWYSGLIPGALMERDAQLAATPATEGVEPATTVLPAPVQGTPMVTAPDAGAKPAEELAPVISNAVPLISVPPASPAGAPAPGAGSPAGAPPAGVAPAAPVAAAAVAAAAAAQSDALVLTVREDSWIEVRPAKGKALFSRMVKGGQVETVTVSGPVTLIVGKPSAVSATLRGEPVLLPAASGGRVARVPLK